MRSHMSVEEIMSRLQELAKDQTKRTYLRLGVQEPLFGITTGALKPLAKEVGMQYEIAMDLYDTGNYDAMYFAGMIVNPNQMTKEDFLHWMKLAYCFPITDYVVSVTLSESPFNETLADEWIQSEDELYVSAGWSCYEWMLGHLPDETFDKEKIRNYLDRIEQHILEQSHHIQYVMNNFVIAVGVSYLPLHQEAMQAARELEKKIMSCKSANHKMALATTNIQKAIDKNRIGFKRKAVRC